MAAIAFDNVSKSFPGGVQAVAGFTLDVRDGEFVVLVGPSGCGKSTALRLLAGLEEASCGTLRIGDRIVNNTPPRERDIAMVFQNYALYPHMTVRENMAFGLTLRKLPPDEISRRISEASGILGLDALLSRRPRELSGGQRQRVALGRAIVRHPAAFLFDEPLSNLDAQLRAQMRVELSRLHQRLKSTMIYVTHDQVEAMTMGDRIVVMKDGRIRQAADPLTVYNSPADLFVAGFIGTPRMNLFPGRIALRSGDPFFRCADGPDVPLMSRPANLPESDLVLGLRPADIPPVEGGTGTLDGIVDVVETLGSETFVHVRSAGWTCVTRAAADTRFRPGQRISLAPRMNRAHLFDARTEQRLALTGAVEPLSRPTAPALSGQ